MSPAVSPTGSRAGSSHPAGLKQRMLEAPSLEACLQLQLAILSEAIPMLTERVRMQQAQRWRSMTTLN